MRLAFAGGGTGGHVVPGVHLVECSRRGEAEGGASSPPIDDLLWFTSGRAVEERVLAGFEPPCPFERETLELEPRGGGAPRAAGLALRLPGAVAEARRALRRHKSEVLLGLGGYIALPAAMAARSLGLPVALLEINAAPGKATRALGPLVQRVFHAWRASLPARGVGQRHKHVGAPLSPEMRRLAAGAGDRARAATELGFDPARPLLLVLGGSQGAGSLNAFLREQVDVLAAGGLQLLHQCGPGRRAEGPEERAGTRVVEYLDPVITALEAADLVLCRGGASTLAELAAARRPAVVVPYPHHADRHQERNARQLGAGVRIVDDDALDAALAADLVDLASPEGVERRLAMSRALASVAPLDAAAEILRELARLCVARAR